MDQTTVEVVVAEIDAWAGRPDALYVETFCEALGWVSDCGCGVSRRILSRPSRAPAKKPLVRAVDHFRPNVFRSSLLARSKMPRCRFDKPLPARFM